jgi:hypothetical protein
VLRKLKNDLQQFDAAPSGRVPAVLHRIARTLHFGFL